MAKMPSQKIKTGPAIGHYVFLLEPRQPREGEEGKKPEFSICLAWDEDDSNLAPIKQAIVNVATQAFGKGAIEQLKGGRIKNPLHRGDVDRPEDENFKGKVYLNAKSTRPVGVVDAKLQPIFESSECYSGCTFRASLNIAAYDHKVGGKGVTAYLNAVQVIRKGKRLDNHVDAAKEFEEFVDAGSAEDSAALDDLL
jgi:hypothetical protein